MPSYEEVATLMGCKSPLLEVLPLSGLSTRFFAFVSFLY